VLVDELATADIQIWVFEDEPAIVEIFECARHRATAGTRTSAVILPGADETPIAPAAIPAPAYFARTFLTLDSQFLNERQRSVRT
jgi:hypothetical protein